MKQEQEKHKENLQVNNNYQYFIHFTFDLAEGYYQYQRTDSDTIVLLRDVFHIGLVTGPRPAILA